MRIAGAEEGCGGQEQVRGSEVQVAGSASSRTKYCDHWDFYQRQMTKRECER